MTSRNITNILKKAYYTATSPAYLSGITTLYNEAKKIHKRIKRSDVRNFLLQQDSYALHYNSSREVRGERKIIVSDVEDTASVDLADMSNLSKFNDGVRWLLVHVNNFSKLLTIVPLKNKSGESVAKAFEQVFKDKKNRTKNLMADRGTEWYNKNVRRVLKKYKINLYSTYKGKAWQSESLIKIIKQKIYRYMTVSDRKHYLTILPKIEQSHNNKSHWQTKIAPVNVNKRNSAEVWRKLFEKYHRRPQTKRKFKIGERVRCRIDKHIFEKGYTQSYTKETYIIKNILLYPTRYIIVDKNNKEEMKKEHELLEVPMQ